MKYGYDKNTDYTKLINGDIERQDWRSAAIHEAQRNEKVLGEGLTQYQTTNHYSAYLPRQEEISSGMDRLAQNQPWKYNAADDPAAQAYRKEFLREADRQTRDTLGSYAQMTGGVPSTAAVSAAQQAGNYQRAQYADKIPELMQADFNRFMTQREQDRSDLSLLASLDRQAGQDSLELQQWDWTKQQQEWENQRQQEQTAYQRALNRWATLGYADEQVSAALGVPVGTKTSDQQYQQSQLEYQQWQRQQQERATAYDRVMTFLMIGQMPDDAALAAAGLSRAEAQKIASYYAARLAAGNGGTGSNPRRPSRVTPQPEEDPEEPAVPGNSSWGEMGEYEYYLDPRLEQQKPGSSELPQSQWQTLLDYLIETGSWVEVRKVIDKYVNGPTAYKWIAAQYQDYLRRNKGILQN